MHRSRELTEQFTASFVTAAVQCLHHKNATKRQVLRVAVEHDGEEAGRMRSGGVGGNRWGDSPLRLLQPEHPPQKVGDDHRDCGYDDEEYRDDP